MTPRLIIQREGSIPSAICGVLMTGAGGNHRRDIGRCQEGQKKKQQRVRGNMQIEIDGAVDEEASASHQAGELQGSGKRILKLTHPTQGFSEQNSQEPSTAESSKNPGFGQGLEVDRKSTRLNSSHSQISYAVFCLKKKNKHITRTDST